MREGTFFRYIINKQTNKHRNIPLHTPPVFCLFPLQTHIPSSRLVFHSPVLSQRTVILPCSAWEEFAVQFPSIWIDWWFLNGGNICGRETKLSLRVFPTQTSKETFTEYNLLQPPWSRNPSTINLLFTSRGIVNEWSALCGWLIVANLLYEL